LGNVGQADQPDVLQAEVEGDQAELAAVAAEQKQLRVWRSLAATIGKPEMPLVKLAGNLENLPPDNPDQWLQAILQDSPSRQNRGAGSAPGRRHLLARAKREPIPDLQLAGRASAKPRTGSHHEPGDRFAGLR